MMLPRSPKPFVPRQTRTAEETEREIERLDRHDAHLKNQIDMIDAYLWGLVGVFVFVVVGTAVAMLVVWQMNS